MSEKVIYDNGNSKLVVKFDGEIVSLVQSSEDLGENIIYLYTDELRDVTDFINEEEKKLKNN